ARGTPAWPSPGPSTTGPAAIGAAQTAVGTDATTWVARPGTIGSGSSVLGVGAVVVGAGTVVGTSMGAASSWPWTGGAADARWPRSRSTNTVPATSRRGTRSTVARRR